MSSVDIVFFEEIYDNYKDFEEYTEKFSPPLWADLFIETKEELKAVAKRLKKESDKTIFPYLSEIWNCFRYTPPHKLRAIIIGEDPYHGTGIAQVISNKKWKELIDNNPDGDGLDDIELGDVPIGMGLAFSVRKSIIKIPARGAKGCIPSSLMTIYEELKRTHEEWTIPTSGSLEKWSHNGVLLFNINLTLEAGCSGSHKFWSSWSASVVEYINNNFEHIVFMFFGLNACNKLKINDLITKSSHKILKAPHPSPINYRRKETFIGSNIFEDANSWLLDKELPIINWWEL